MPGEFPQKEGPDAPQEEKLAVGREELARQELQAKIAEISTTIEADLSSLPNLQEEDIPAIRQIIQSESQKPHKELRDFLRSIRREISENEQISEESAGAFDDMIGRVLTQMREKEAAEYLAKPLFELLEMLKEKQDKREIVPRSLLNAALQKIKERIEEGARTSEAVLDRETYILRELIQNREIHDELIEYIGTKAMELVAFISSQEREPQTAENLPTINKAKKDLSFYRGLIFEMFREQVEVQEVEEKRVVSENEDLENFENVEVLYGTLNRYIGVDTRPGYTFSRFFPRFLLEVLVRKREIEHAVPPEVMSDLTRRADRVASFVNRKRFLDLGQELKRGEPSPRFLRSLKIKMFLDIYPDAWSGFETVSEQYAEQAKAFMGGLAKIYRKGAEDPDSFRKSAEKVVDAKDPDLDEALVFGNSLQDLAGFKSSIFALREAYGIRDKQKADEVEELFRRLQIARGRKGVFVGGRGAKERGTEARGGKGRKRRRRADEGIDRKMRAARDRVEKLKIQKRKAEELAGEEGAEISDADKEFAEKTLGRKIRAGGIEEINRDIARTEGFINRLQRRRTTESDAKEGVYRIKKHAEIEDDLSQAVRELDPNMPIGETMRRLNDLLFSV